MRFKYLFFGLITVLSFFNLNFSFAACTLGLQACSSSYGVTQTSISSGSSTNLSSSNYGAAATVGDLTVGNISSKSFQAYTGFNTTDVPYIQLLANNPNVCSGSLNAGTYYFKVTALDVSNLEITPSTEQSLVLPAGQSCIYLSWPVEGNASSYRVYFSQSSGGENQYFSTANNWFTFSQTTGATSATPPVSSSSAASVPSITTINGVNQIGPNGYLSTSHISTATSTFSVRCWVCSGYSITYYGAPPTNGVYSMLPFSGLYTYYSASQPSANQFGMNLAVNSIAGVGAAPTSPTLPSYGVVNPSYNSSDVFLYNSGDQIAYSYYSTSITLFTMSYLFKISGITPYGQYNFSQNIIATGTY